MCHEEVLAGKNKWVEMRWSQWVGGFSLKNQCNPCTLHFLKYNILFPLWISGSTSLQLSWLAEQSSPYEVFPAPHLLPADLIIKNVLLRYKWCFSLNTLNSIFLSFCFFFSKSKNKPFCLSEKDHKPLCSRPATCCDWQ